ncbi:MAG: DoxX family protein [Capsulimonas sp.]|uniref:DoxX family protein n=1 Tax=Capsulimonas sp. TaxID=2494211 RepID=UPI003265A490
MTDSPRQTTPGTSFESAFDTVARRVLRVVLALVMIWVGCLHFLHPEPFISIVPHYLPAPRALVLVSGFFEALGGLGLLLPFVRLPAAIGLIALYIAVFPANISMALNDTPINGQHFPALLLWLRLPLQFVLIAWAWWVRRD